MNLLKLRLFQGGLFKQAKFLLSSPQNAQKVIYISEAGTVTQEILPVSTGYVSSVVKKTWIVLHSLKYQVHKNGEPVQDEQVLLITDRSYIPLDPNETMKPKEKERLASLKDIARLRHAETRMDAGKPDQGVDIATTVVNGSFILLGIMLLVSLLRGCA